MPCPKPRQTLLEFEHFHAYSGLRRVFRPGDLVQTKTDNVYRIRGIYRDEKGLLVKLVKVRQGTHSCPTPIGSFVLLRNPLHLNFAKELAPPVAASYTNNNGTMRVGTEVLYPFFGNREPDRVWEVESIDGPRVYLKGFYQSSYPTPVAFPHQLKPLLVRDDISYKAGDVVSLGSYLKHEVAGVDGDCLIFKGGTKSKPNRHLMHYATWEAKEKARQDLEARSRQRIERTLTLNFMGERAYVDRDIKTVLDAFGMTTTRDKVL